MNDKKILSIKKLFLLFLLLPGCSFVARWPAFHIEKAKVPQNLYRGVFHVHTEFSHDSKASLETVIRTAETAGLDFVVVTDHNNMNGKAAYEAMPHPENPLLIFGDEISTRDGHLIALGVPEAPSNDDTHADELVKWIHAHGGYAMLPHLIGSKNAWKNLEMKSFDGVDIYNYAHTSFFDASNKLNLALQIVFLPPGPFLRSVEHRSQPMLDYWDKRLEMGKYTAFGSADAHMRFLWNGLTPENYLLYFQAVTTYVWADQFNEKTIVESLGKGKSFIAFEAFGDASGFSFSASQDSQNYGPGEDVSVASPVRFLVKLSSPGDIRLIHSGKIIQQVSGTTLEYTAQEPGAYRVEVDKAGKLWIVCNPIYLKQ